MMISKATVKKSAMFHVEQKESGEHTALVEWAYYKGLILQHSPNELMRFLNKGQKIHQLKLGTRIGFPDLMLLKTSKNYGALFIELKSRKGRISSEQKKWISWLNLNGYKAVVCYSFEEAQKTVENYLLDI